MTDLVSPRTRRAFQESYVGFAVLRQITADFSDAGVSYQELPDNHVVCGERRSLVEGYYLTVDWSSRRDVRLVLNAYECHLLRLSQNSNEDAKDEARRLIANLEMDGLSYESRKIVIPQPTVVDEHIIDETLSVDVSQLHRNIDRIRNAVETDPSLAIGAAKEVGRGLL